jgi:hypothetical protein
MVAEGIERAQQKIDERFGDRHGAVAHVREQRLERMGEPLKRDIAEGARAALDRVDPAKDRVNGIGVLGAFLAGGQALFGCGQRFLALGEEDGLDFLGVHASAPSKSSRWRPIWAAASRSAGEGSITAPSPLRRALTRTWNIACPIWVQALPSI